MYRLNNRIQSVILLLIIALGLASIVFGIKIHPAKPARAATTYTVTNGNNAGVGSLRQAITDANANPGADVIVFSGALTIQPTSSLPPITDPVEINGYTGSPGGATPNTAVSPNPFNGTLTVELDGQLAAGSVAGLTFNSGSEGSSVRGLVVYNFTFNEIQVNDNFTGSGLTIAGNYIGTNATGTVAQGSTLSYGIGLFGTGASNIAIGGTNPADRNIISGNAGGIGGGANNNATIQGNYIGLAADGVTPLANTNHGIDLWGATTNSTIGGSSASASNVISSNSFCGINFASADNNHNTIAGNFIGTDYTGTIDLGNLQCGILMYGATDSNTIGGTSTGSRNIISGNTSNGIAIDSSNNNTILGNYIGTDASGTVDLGNGNNGISLDESDSNTIGGTTGVTLGGNCTGACNLIAGNDADGIGLFNNSDSNTVLGSFVGSDVTGKLALTNTGNGIQIASSSESNIIGGTSTGSRNIISGNTQTGVTIIDAGTSSNSIVGNFVGTDTTGQLDLGNGTQGIIVGLDSDSTMIGGTTEQARNVVSGNTGGGLSLGGNSATARGNYIGLTADGLSTLANGTENANTAGVHIFGDNKVVGGTTAGSRNIISGNNGFGVSITGLTPFGGSSANNNVIQGNCIGTNANCQYQAGFGNPSIGVVIVADALNSVVGGTVAGSGNVITGNGAGVVVLGIGSAYPLNASVLGNSIYNNKDGPFSQIGIDNLQTSNLQTFINQNVTANDANDIDYDGINTGPNHYLNFPELTTVTSTNGTATITYNLDINDTEAGATGYRVEFFANDSADPSGNGQGQTYLGSDTVSGDVTGRQATITLPAGVDGSKYITATTTMTDNSSDGFGHSSEFAANLQATLVPASTPSGGSSSIANTGQAQNNKPLIIIASVLIALGAIGIATLAVTKIRKRKLR